MSGNYLYINPFGKPSTLHSHSAGQTFEESPYKYYLKYCQGWKELDNGAAREFGKAVESAVQFCVENDGHGGVNEFSRLWAKHEHAALIYGKKDGDWANLQMNGEVMLEIFEQKLHTLPLCFDPKPRFQAELRKEVFPKSYLAGIEFTARLDIITKTVQFPDRLIIDMKTRGTPLNVNPKVIAAKRQLRAYSWVSGIRDVAILAFVKSQTREKIQVQFAAGQVSEESAKEAGHIVGQQIANIVMCREKGIWPNTWDVDYPKNNTSDPYFQAFVLGDTKTRDEKLVHKTDKDGFEEDE